MPIYRLFQNSSFDPERIEMMTSAFEYLSLEFGLTQREDALRDIIARAVIECAQRGIHDPQEMRKCAHDLLQEA